MLRNPEKLVLHTETIVEVCQSIKDESLSSYFCDYSGFFLKSAKNSLIFFDRLDTLSGLIMNNNQ